MGLLTDTLFCILVGIICVLAAHFIFGVPFSSGSMRMFFLLGLLGWATIDYIGKRSETGAALATIFIIVLGIVLVIFFVLPLITHSSNKTTEIPVTPSPVVTARFHSVPSQPTPTLVDPYRRTYEWTYAGRSRTYTIEIPQSLYADYKNKSHSDTNYAKYAITPEDRKVLDSIVMDFERNSDSKSEAAYNIVAFVQSLPYVKDKASTGFDNYARYPIETLVDNKGDCEDTAILTAALLKEMRYGVVLIHLPGHVAVGVKCSGCSGYSYEIHGEKYYYIETTGENWKIGQMPPEYYDVKATMMPM
jgi:hypothetical protein